MIHLVVVIAEVVVVAWALLCITTVGGRLTDLATEAKLIRLALEAQNRFYEIPVAVEEEESDAEVR